MKINLKLKYLRMITEDSLNIGDQLVCVNKEPVIREMKRTGIPYGENDKWFVKDILLKDSHRIDNYYFLVNLPSNPDRLVPLTEKEIKKWFMKSSTI
jgi:hypothetical protein